MGNTVTVTVLTAIVFAPSARFGKFENEGVCGDIEERHWLQKLERTYYREIEQVLIHDVRFSSGRYSGGRRAKPSEERVSATWELKSATCDFPKAERSTSKQQKTEFCMESNSRL